MRLLIFDFDGTLADTGQVIIRTLSQTLSELGLEPPAPEALREYIGLPLARIFERASASEDQELISKAVRIYRARFPENCKKDIRLYPGVREALERFQNMGLSLAIASSRERNSLLALVDQVGIASFFSVIAGEQDVQKHKPEPDIAKFVCEKTGIPANEAMFIGDTIYDIGAGRAAGMLTCGIAYGNHTGEHLLEAGADFVIDRFDGLVPIVIGILNKAPA